MEQLKQLLTAAGIAYKENEPLAAHCTFKIGGPARLFVQPTDRAQLCRVVALCKAQGVRQGFGDVEGVFELFFHSVKCCYVFEFEFHYSCAVEAHC